MQLSDVNVTNAKAVLSAVSNMFQRKQHIMEQAEERAQRCLQNKAGCIQEHKDTNGNISYTYTRCDSCGCSAPSLFWADTKHCANWTDLQTLKSEAEWIEYKHNKLRDALHNVNEESGNGQPGDTTTIPGHTLQQEQEGERAPGANNVLLIIDTSSEI